MIIHDTILHFIIGTVNEQKYRTECVIHAFQNLMIQISN